MYLMNLYAKIINTILASQTKWSIKIIVHHDQVGFTLGPSHQQAGEDKSHNYINRYRKSMATPNTIKYTEFQRIGNRRQIFFIW